MNVVNLYVCPPLGIWTSVSAVITITLGDTKCMGIT